MAGRSLHKAYAALKADDRPMASLEIIPERIPDIDNAALIYEGVILQLKAEAAGEQSLFEHLDEMADKVLTDPLDAEALEQFRQLAKDEIVLHSLTALVRGTRKPSYWHDTNYSDGAAVLLTHLADLKRLTRVLCANASLQSANGNHDAAWETAIASLRMADDLKNEPLLLNQLVRFAQHTISIHAIHSIGASSVPTDSQLKELKVLLEGFDDIAPFVAAMDGERLIFGEWAFNLKFDEITPILGNSHSSMLDWILHFSPLRMRDHAAHLNLMHIQTKMAGQHYSPDDGTTVNQRLDKLPFYCILTRLLMPAINQVKRRYLQMIANTRLTRAGLAALSYRQNNGPYPSDLSALGTEEFIDPFTQKPLVYQTTPTGFVIYSVGLNLIDDGGITTENSMNGDVVWRHAEKVNTAASN